MIYSVYLCLYQSIHIFSEVSFLDNKNKKLLCIIIPVVIILAVAITVTVILFGSKDDKNGIVVTDENGVVVTNVDGTPVTVVPETEIVDVTDSDGNTVLDEKGNPVTTVVYKDSVVTVPKTDENGSTIWETVVVKPEVSYTGGEYLGTTVIPVTDGQGNTGVDSEGNLITTIVDVTAAPSLDIEPADVAWKYTRGGTQTDYISDMIATPDKCYITSTVTNSTDGDYAQFASLGYATPYTVLTKTDDDGKIVWEKAFGSKKGIFNIKALDVASDGSIYAAGYGEKFYDISTRGYYDGFVAKFSSKGELLWIKSFGTSTVDMLNGICVTSDGGVVAVGSVGNNDYDAEGFGGKELNSRAAAVKYSSSGELVWKNFFGGDRDFFDGVAEGKDGSLFIVGTFYSDELFEVMGAKDSTGLKQSDAGVVKLSSSGKFVAVKAISGTKTESFTGITAISDGGVVIVGRSNSSDSSDSSSFFTGDLAARGDYDAYIIRLSEGLEPTAASAFRGQNAERLQDVIETDSGNFIAVGYTNSSTRDLKGVTTRGGDDIVIAGFSSRCSLLWARSFGGKRDDSAAAIVKGVSGGYVIAGRSLSMDADLANIAPYSGNYSVGVVVKFPE